MLDNNQKYIIKLLQQSIIPNGKSPDSAEIDVDFVANTIVRSGILLTVFPLIEKDSSLIAKELCKRLSQKYYSAMRLAVLHNSEGQLIHRALDKACFDHIFLKGWKLRDLYPDYTQRGMNDIDILVKDYKYKPIKHAMESLGYESHGNSYWMHDNYSKGLVSVEIHKRLSNDFDSINSWEREIWKNAKHSNADSNLYDMSEEDFYIFHIIHMFTDFRSGSFGLRRVADTWLLMREFNGVDSEYVRENLDSLGMMSFNERIQQLARCCFDDVEFDHNSEVMLRYAMVAGISGNGNSNKASRVVVNSKGTITSGKIMSIKNSVFPSIKRMKSLYPILNKHIYLLPFCWINRVSFHLCHFSKYKRQIDYSNISEEDYLFAYEALVAGGILSGKV